MSHAFQTLKIIFAERLTPNVCFQETELVKRAYVQNQEQLKRPEFQILVFEPLLPRQGATGRRSIDSRLLSTSGPSFTSSKFGNKTLCSYSKNCTNTRHFQTECDRHRIHAYSRISNQTGVEQTLKPASKKHTFRVQNVFVVHLTNSQFKFHGSALFTAKSAQRSLIKIL